MIKESLTVKVTFGKYLKEVRELDLAAVWRKSVPSRRNGKSHEEGICVECCRNNKAAHEAGVRWVRVREVGAEVRAVTGMVTFYKACRPLWEYRLLPWMKWWSYCRLLSRSLICPDLCWESPWILCWGETLGVKDRSRGTVRLLEGPGQSWWWLEPGSSSGNCEKGLDSEYILKGRSDIISWQIGWRIQE